MLLLDWKKEFLRSGRSNLQNEVTIHSRFKFDNRCIALACQHLLSSLKQNCEAVTPPT